MKTQQEQILNHLKYRGPITPLAALNLYGSFRLGAVIFNLKALGHNIKTDMVSNGRKHFAKYTLVNGAAHKPYVNETIEKMKQWEQERKDGLR